MSAKTKHTLWIQKEGYGKASVHSSNGTSVNLPDADTVPEGTSYEITLDENGKINILIQELV